MSLGARGAQGKSSAGFCKGMKKVQGLREAYNCKKEQKTSTETFMQDGGGLAFPPNTKRNTRNSRTEKANKRSSPSVVNVCYARTPLRKRKKKKKKSAFCTYREGRKP